MPIRTLRPKPAPDGYLYLLKTLHADAKHSVALEDSNPGIASARAAGLSPSATANTYRWDMSRGDRMVMFWI